MRGFSFLIYAVLIASVNVHAVRVCTFNMRAPVDGPPNDWAARKGRMAQVIVGHECAVVGLQEAQHDTTQDLLGELNARTSGNTSYCLAPFGGVDNAIAFYCHMAVIDTKEWAISDTPDQIGSNTWGLAYARTLLFVKLTLSADMRGANKTMIYVYATHLDIIDALQGRQVDFIADRMRDSYAHDGRVAIVGDFNAGEGSEAIKKFADLGFEDTLPKDIEPRSTFNGFGGYSGAKIDYVLATPCAKTSNAAIVRDLVDGQFPSDHAMVMADVEADYSATTP